MTKHTPGPWEFSKAKFLKNGKEKFSVTTKVNDYTNRVICETPFTDKYKDHEANARLIAVAPELLEALKILYYAHSDDIDDYPDKQLYDIVMYAMRKAKEAINKAEGEK